MFIISSEGVQGDSSYEIRRLESLVDDLDRILRGEGPSEAELAEAPVLDGYGIAIMKRPCLVGAVTGHPVFGQRIVRTSELWAIAPDLGWARTHSRFYRLGTKRTHRPI